MLQFVFDETEQNKKQLLFVLFLFIKECCVLNVVF